MTQGTRRQDLSTASTGDAPFEAMGRLARAAASVEPDPAHEAIARARFVERASQTRRSRLLLGSFGLVAAGAAVVALVFLRPDAPVTYQVSGNELGATAMRPEAPLLPEGTVVRFSEGTEIDLGAATRGRVAETTPDGARIVLDQGSLVARVAHRRGARWAVEAGPFTVRVTGTSFRVRWHKIEGRFAIGMRAGSVIVEGPGFSQRLGAGQRLEASVEAGIIGLGAGDIADNDAPSAATAPVIVPLPAAVPAEAPPPAPVSPPAGSAESRPAARAATPAEGAPLRSVRAPSSWSRRVTAGDFASVVAEAEQDGPAAGVGRRGLDDLVALAAAARLTDRPELARRALQAQRQRFATTASGREAAFYLGRLTEDADKDPRGAIRWYDRYLAEAPSGALAAEALGRKMMAHVRLGPADRPGAEAAARVYLERFPHGPHAAAARSVVDQAR